MLPEIINKAVLWGKRAQERGKLIAAYTSVELEINKEKDFSKVFVFWLAGFVVTSYLKNTISC